MPATFDDHDEPKIIELGDSLLRLDELTGFVAEGDVVGVNQDLAAGRKPLLINPLGWPTAAHLRASTTEDAATASRCRVAVMDELVDIGEDRALLRPPSLVVGVVPLSDASADDVADALTIALAGAGLSRSSVVFVGTPDDCGPEDLELERRTQLVAGRRSVIRLATRTFPTAKICIARRHPSSVEPGTRWIDLRDTRATSLPLTSNGSR